jgi:hypothetical protein
MLIHPVGHFVPLALSWSWHKLTSCPTLRGFSGDKSLVGIGGDVEVSLTQITLAQPLIPRFPLSAQTNSI